MKTNTIIHGDCIKKMKKLLANSIDAIITDPPFNIGKKYGDDKDNKKLFEYYDWCYDWIDECIRVLKPTGNLYIMNFPRHLAFLYVHLVKRGMIYKNWITWIRNDNSPYSKRTQFKPNHQDILRFVKSKEFYFDWRSVSREPIWKNDKRVKDKAGQFDTWSDITYVKGNSKEKVNHPCPWPIKLVERMILSSSKEGDVILDPFGGSGTTMVACIQNNRNCILIEKEEEYINLTKERIKPYLEQTTLK